MSLVPEPSPFVKKLVASAIKRLADLRGPLRGVMLGTDVFDLLGILPGDCTLFGLAVAPLPSPAGPVKDALDPRMILLGANGSNESITLGFPRIGAQEALKGSWWRLVTGSNPMGELIGYDGGLPVLMLSATERVRPEHAWAEWVAMPLPGVAQVWSSYINEYPCVVTGVHGGEIEYMMATVLETVTPDADTFQAELAAESDRRTVPVRKFLEVFHYNSILREPAPTVWDRLLS